MKIKDLLLVSDLDGTIIPMSGVISERNIDAIERFRRSGGTFAVATGRSPLQARYICDTLDVSGMIICNNGACIYDVNQDRNYWAQNLDSRYIEVIDYVLREFAQVVGIQAISDKNDYYTVNETQFLKKEISCLTHDNIECTDVSTLPGNICKVLFLIDLGSFDEVTSGLLSQNFHEFEFVKSGGCCFEMMHKGITKSYPMQKLAEIYDKLPENIVAIGDYYNDVDMLKMAHFSAAVANAPKEVQELADIVVKSCEDDGLADFIDKLFEKFKA